jgi:hypothetical protein
MGSVASVNPGVAALLQTLTNVDSPVMSQPAAVSALQKAPAGDIVQLSAAATELQSVDELFGVSQGSGSNTGMSSILASLGSSLTSSAEAAANGQPASTALSSASPAEQLANYQAVLQGAESQGLFGTGTNIGLSGSLFNAIA